MNDESKIKKRKKSIKNMNECTWPKKKKKKIEKEKNE